MSSDNDIFPDVVRIEASGLCNFKCIHCPTGIQPNGRQVLDEKKFSIIMEQFIANNFIPRVVVLYHGGEPLLNKYLGQYIRLLKNMGVAKTVITTNSSLLSKEKAAELILAGLDELKVSFDGESANENNSIRKNGDFYSNADNVKSLCKIRKILGRKNPTIIIYNTRICDKITLNTLNKSRRFIFQEAPQYITDYFKNECKEIEFKSLPAMVWPGFQQFGKLETVCFPSESPQYCGSLFETFTILVDGKVVPCCYDLRGEIKLGNIFEKNMFDIWNSPEYIEMREDFKKQKYRQFCHRCRVVKPIYLCK